MPLERKRRKRSFDADNSVPIVLADGQSWWLPKPWLVICPVFQGGTARTSYPFFCYDDRVEALIGTVRQARKLAEQVCAVATIGALLLRFQYELSDDELGVLFRFKDNDEGSKDWLQTIMEVATGADGPKQ